MIASIYSTLRLSSGGYDLLYKLTNQRTSYLYLRHLFSPTPAPAAALPRFGAPIIIRLRVEIGDFFWFKFFLEFIEIFPLGLYLYNFCYYSL